MTLFGMDTYVTSQSYEIARLAVGGALRGVEAVVRGEVDSAIVAIRPPGHHATRTHGMGFCLLNNVAIAARCAQSTYEVERVLIVDYDVHHGNGTQDIFYTDPTVLYISTHESPLYPGTGTVRETGEDAGEGYTLNIPMPAGVGDEGYRCAFEQVVIPAAQRFRPDLVLVSAGFDAHWGEPLAHMRLSLAGYDGLARLLIDAAQDLCGGRIVFVMEGGYNLPVLAHGWANVTRALLGEGEGVDPLGPAPGKEPPVDGLVGRIRQLHKLV
jgi:acetoin utilization deacetylase AcuC-like enzyme